MSGMLHCEESDYTTAYSYFLEAFDAYDQSNQKPSATTSLKYMILCKVLNSAAHEVPSLLASKIGVKHSGIDLEAMAAIARAAKSHSLEEFEKAVSLSIWSQPPRQWHWCRLFVVNFRQKNTKHTWSQMIWFHII